MLIWFNNYYSLGRHRSQKCPHQCCRATETDPQNHEQNHNVYLYFFILSSEIAGSIISLITLLDMMHQNLSFTGIHNKTQGYTMDTQLTVLPIALTTVNDSFKIFFFPFGCSFSFFF